MNENTNTLDRLRRMNAPTGAVSEEIVQQDLARGRAAVAHAHRRQGWIAGGVGGFALTAIVAVGAILPAVQTGTPPEAGASDTGTSHQITAKPAMQLVAYTGIQPDGYHLGKVPDGFTVEASDQHNLILAPTELKTSDSNGMADEYMGKIVISQQGSFTYTRDRREVTVNGSPALIAEADDGDSATEVQFTTDGHTVNIQIWDATLLTDQQIVDFAQSITVTGNPTTFGG